MPRFSAINLSYISIMHLKELYCYPIKSLNGIALHQAVVTDTGLPLDRNWMLVDEQNQFITRRTFPKLALLQVSLENDHLVVENDRRQLMIRLRYEENATVIESKVWNSPITGREVSAAAHDFFSSFLGKNIRLIQQDFSIPRIERIPQKETFTPSSLADSFPIHVIGTASLNFLNEHLNPTIHAGYFRPNIVIETNIPFEEDHLDILSFENVTLQKAKLCGRCKMVNVDPSNGEVINDVLKTLAAFRTFENSIKLGVLFYVTRKGNLSIGETYLG